MSGAPAPSPRFLAAPVVLSRDAVPDGGAAALVAIVGVVEIVTRSLGWLGLLVVIGAAVSVGLARTAPAYALAVVWATGAIQVLAGREVFLVEVVAALAVAYATSRYGSRGLMWASGLSIPLAASGAVLWVALRGVGFAYSLPGFVYPLAYSGGGGVLLAAGWFLVAALLGVPWFAGLAVRARTQANRSRVQQLAAEEAREYAEGERVAAQQIASLRAEQTRLARDVHDVVGHSLAVILVQAESAAFLPDDDLARIRMTVANIATSARRSLQDVRAVLSSTGDPVGADIRSPSIDELVTDLREAGNDVRSEVVGEPWSLTTEDQTLVFRLAQEMLTNALKHGLRGAPVLVEQRWRGDLMLEVHNTVGPGAGGDSRPSGLGIAGMRRRLDEVGGRLAVRHRDTDGSRPAEFTATAWIPTADDDTDVAADSDVDAVTAARAMPSPPPE